MPHYYSPANNAFLDGDLADAYKAAGSWPADARKVSDAVFQEFALSSPPEGKRRIAREGDGAPAWADVEPPSADQVKAAQDRAVQRHLDAAAVALGFTSIADAMTYVDEPAVPLFQQQAQQLRAWRSLTWLKAQEVQAETPTLTAQQLVAELPEFIFTT